VIEVLMYLGLTLSGMGLAGMWIERWRGRAKGNHRVVLVVCRRCGRRRYRRYRRDGNRIEEANPL
jgi:hypothetical protein